MPFTFAHPAIILPLKYLPKKWISTTALITGSVMPDFEAFLRMYSEKEMTHSWLGFFLFGLPMGILVTFIFHNTIRNPLINNLPAFLQLRFSRFTTFNWNQRFSNNAVAVIVSLLIGGASHFFWDSFSHFNGWFINRFPSLKGNVRFFQTELEIPYLIQYVNTLLGIAIIILFIAQLPRIKNRLARNPIKFWLRVAVIACAIMVARIIYKPDNSLDDLIIGLTSAFLFALIIVAFWSQRFGSRSQKPGDSSLLT